MIRATNWPDTVAAIRLEEGEAPSAPGIISYRMATPLFVPLPLCAFAPLHLCSNLFIHIVSLCTSGRLLDHF